VDVRIEQVAGLGDAALAYCRRGWSIVPMHSPVSGGCSCRRRDCAAVAKHPRVSWEALMEVAATEKQVEQWWRRWPDANVGVVTGRVSGIVVLDVDPRSDGGLALGDLEQRSGALPATAEVQTGAGARSPDELTPAPLPEWLKVIAHDESDADRHKPRREQANVPHKRTTRSPKHGRARESSFAPTRTSS
jgi:bifunctional DNA primase/polymerase-like protein